MDRTIVNSTDIVSIGYDEQTLALEVEFKRGEKLYIYRDVPRKIFEELMVAPSKGRYLASRVKGIFSYSTKNKETKNA